MTLGFKRAFIVFLACTSVAWTQRRSDTDARAAIEKIRLKALDYTRLLPDFVCTEVIHRFTRPRPLPVSARHWQNSETNWILTDKLTIKLSYFQQKEDHELMLIDDKPTDQHFENLQGAVGLGEFGGIFHSIFDPATETAFHWKSWKNVRQHRTDVYTYVVPAARSRYFLMSGKPGDTRQDVVGFHGTFEVDGETTEVLNFTYQADHIPRELGLDDAVTTVDYDFADIGGQNYLLPARGVSEVRSLRLETRNRVEFRKYRKFSAHSTLTFGPVK